MNNNSPKTHFQEGAPGTNPRTPYLGTPTALRLYYTQQQGQDGLLCSQKFFD